MKYTSWEDISVIKRPIVFSSCYGQFSYLNKSKNSSVSFRYFQDVLEINTEIALVSTKNKVVDLFMIPSERKKWDLKLSSMVLIDEGAYNYDYLTDRRHYYVTSNLEVIESMNYVKVVIHNTEKIQSVVCLEFDETQDDNFKSTHDIDSHTTAESYSWIEKNYTIRLLWNVKCYNDFTKIFRPDTVQESQELLKSVDCLIRLAQDDHTEGLVKKNIQNYSFNCWQSVCN